MRLLHLLVIGFLVFAAAYVYRIKLDSTVRTEQVLKLLHPQMPFVTEEIWSFLPGERGLLAAASWPASDPADEEAELVVGNLIEAVSAVRRWRTS